MSKTRNKEGSEVEYWRGRVRKLEATNRRLRKRNKQLERKAHFHEDVIDDIAGDIAPTGEICQECGKGQLTTIDLKFLLIESCDVCEYKRKIKPKGVKR